MTPKQVPPICYIIKTHDDTKMIFLETPDGVKLLNNYIYVT